MDNGDPIGSQNNDPQSWDLFISYSRRDNDSNRITELKERIEADYLEFAGEPLRCFFDVGSIHGMDDWRHRILQALRDSQLLLLVLSPSYLASEYCQWEIVEYLKYEHARAAAGQGIAPVYFVEVPGLDSPDFEKQAADWIAQVRRRNHFDLRPWNDEGSEALKRLDVAKRLEELEQALYQRISRLRRAAEAQGNLASPNPYFVGRETEMQRLHETTGLGRHGSLSVIQGVGGLGKTSLATQYAHAYADFFPGGRWIIPCANKLSLASAIRDLSIDLGLTFEETEKDNDELAAKRVLVELERSARDGAESRAGEKTPPQPRSLLLLDNVETGDMLQPPQTDLLSGRRWLHVLATTRLGGEDFGHDPDLHNLLSVDELPLADSVRLIERHQVGGQFPNKKENQAAEQIVEMLGGFTLAVEVVANFLGERRGRVSCADFLQRLRNEGFDRVAPNARRSVRHGEKLVGATLEPTLALLEPAETLVLACAALLPPDLIPLPWIRAIARDEYPEIGVDAEPGYDDPWLDLVNHLLGLRLLQVVDVDTNTNTPRLVRMHRLIGELVRAKNTEFEDHRIERLIFHTIARSNHLESAWFEPRCRWEVEPLVAFVQKMVASGHEAAPVLVKNIGIWHVYTGDLERNASLHLRTIEALEAHHGHDELDVAVLCSNLGTTLKLQGKIGEAEARMRRALEIRRGALPPDHPGIATTLNNLALLLRDQGKLDEAEPMLREALEIKQKASPPGDIGIATSLGNLATFLQSRGNLDEAEPMLREALEIVREKLPSGHPTIATCLQNLASLLLDKGELDEAETLFRETLDIRRKALSEDHPDIGMALNNLAMLLKDQGKLDEAESILYEALEIDKKAFPAGHSSVASKLNNLALLLQARDKLDEAEPVFVEALDISREVLPPTHPDIALALNNLAMLYEDQGRLDEAEPMLREGLSLYRKSLPAEHPMIATCQTNLARLLHTRCKLEEAESLFREALEIRRKALPVNHQDIGISLNKLAMLLQEQNKLDEAESLYREVLDIYPKDHPERYPVTVESMDNLAALLWQQGRLNETEQLLSDLVGLSTKLLPADHPGIALRLQCLAAFLASRGEIDRAEEIYREAIDIFRKTQPPEHSDYASALLGLAQLLHDRGKLDEAEQLYREMLVIQRKTLPPNHPDLALDLNNLALLLRTRGAYEESAIMLRQAIEIEQACLPNSNPKLPHRLNNLAMVLMLSGELDSAAKTNAEAWQLKCEVTDGGHDITSARILVIRIALAWLAGTDPASLLGQLKTLLSRQELPAYGNVSIRWDVADVLEQLRSRLPGKEEMELLAALVEALNDPDQIAALDRFSIWCNQAPVALDAPLTRIPA